VNDCVEIQNFISKLLLDLDENCHFILASRTLLSLPVIPMLAAQSEVDGMSYEELEFLSEEIQALFQQNQQLSLSIDQADEIKQNTEGWITGILLTSQVDKKLSTLQARLGRVSGFSLQDCF
jgi:LuxR family maltose regulon positive regulatory protein